jgi:hypothetical protein
MSWSNVKGMKYVDGSLGSSDALQIIHPQKGWLGAKTTKVKLPGLKKAEKARFKAVVGEYWHRHKVADTAGARRGG